MYVQKFIHIIYLKIYTFDYFVYLSFCLTWERKRERIIFSSIKLTYCESIYVCRKYNRILFLLWHRMYRRCESEVEARQTTVSNKYVLKRIWGWLSGILTPRFPTYCEISTCLNRYLFMRYKVRERESK